MSGGADRAPTWLTRSHEGDDCEQALAEARAELAELNGDAEPHADTDGQAASKFAAWVDSFEGAEPDSELEAQADALVDSAFDGLEVDAEIECRGDVCRVDLVTPGSEPVDAFDRILEAEGYDALATSIQAGPPTPAVDVASQETSWSQRAWLKMRPRGKDSGWDVLEKVFAGFQEQSETQDCDDMAGSGELVVQISVSDDYAFTAEIGGGLAASQAGQCYAAALREYLDAQSGPREPGVSSATRTFRMEKSS